MSKKVPQDANSKQLVRSKMNFRESAKIAFYALIVIFIAVIVVIIWKIYLDNEQQGLSNIGEAQDLPYSRYSRGNGKIYYLKVGSGYYDVDSADAGTFKAFNTVNDRGTMGKDARHVFFKTAIVPGLKPEEVIYMGNNFCKTKHGIFYGNTHLKTADSASFHYIRNYYAADGKHLYYKQNVVIGADANSLQAIIYDTEHGNPPDEYIRDRNHVYFRGICIKGAQPSAFTFLKVEDDAWDTQYAFDGVHYFNEEHEVLVDQDEAKTQLKLLSLDKGFGWYGIFYQGTEIYCYDTDRHELVFMGSRDNSTPFSKIDRGIFTDNRHLYFTFGKWNRSGGRMPQYIGHTTGLCVVKEANPHTFKAAGSFVTQNKIEGTLYRSGKLTYFHPSFHAQGNYSPGLMLMKADGTTEQLPTNDGLSKFIRDDSGTSIFSLQFYKNLLKADSVYDDY
ncbi:hypothetical protein HH214_20465 [Mucilaginibacter robiniae]|uniref:DKNYY family protein n=1 Tax=Mucilaginibacter robiniae TaxID=2728022 RepID=A0A7L5E425_9SPHI|nr:DKNYY domain-containing protein [Mucilaginibacter robiniae]QJD98080.1 hypothetical protein HH214_20465 [Mucilaginibacter robiniae]